MKCKKFLIILSSFAMLLSACGGTAPHEHTFDSKWDTNESSHWHKATCEHTDLTKDLGAHIDSNSDGKCDVCLYDIPVPPVPPVPHEHTFDDKWTNNESSHWHAATCEHTELTKDLATHTFGDDDICTVCGYEKEIQPVTYCTVTFASDVKKVPFTIFMSERYGGYEFAYVGTLEALSNDTVFESDPNNEDYVFKFGTIKHVIVTDASKDLYTFYGINPDSSRVIIYEVTIKEGNNVITGYDFGYGGNCYLFIADGYSYSAKPIINIPATVTNFGDTCLVTVHNDLGAVVNYDGTKAQFESINKNNIKWPGTNVKYGTDNKTLTVNCTDGTLEYELDH